MLANRFDVLKALFEVYEWHEIPQPNGWTKSFLHWSKPGARINYYFTTNTFQIQMSRNCFKVIKHARLEDMERAIMQFN